MAIENEINWTIYDIFQNFSHLDAAYLLIGVEPNDINGTPPAAVRMMLDRLKKWEADQNWGRRLWLTVRLPKTWKEVESTRISRDKLIRFANAHNIHPPFLSEDAKITGTKVLDELHPTERKTLLSIINRLLELQHIDITEREATRKFVALTGISENTARKYLKQIKDIK